MGRRVVNVPGRKQPHCHNATAQASQTQSQASLLSPTPGLSLLRRNGLMPLTPDVGFDCGSHPHAQVSDLQDVSAMLSSVFRARERLNISVNLQTHQV